MKGAIFSFNFKDLNLSVPQIENFMGYREGDDTTLVTGLIDEVLREAAEICDIRAQYSIFDNVSIDYSNKALVIETSSFNVRKIVFTQLKRSASIAIFVCTAGEEIGRRSRKAMKERDLLLGYV